LVPLEELSIILEVGLSCDYLVLFNILTLTILDSQERVRDMKAQLKVCKESLMTKRSDLLQLWFRSQQYKEMIRILDQM
jgi:hypothetical protein